MDAENVDPRHRPLPPTQEEVDAWAVRERRRRAAWLAGPTDEEKHEWARRYRWRAALGLEESRLGPASEEVELWAEREHQRRTAWLAGPSETERARWRQRHERSAEPPLQPTAEEVEAWAAREAQRRREWVNGPSEEEKQHWAQRQTEGLFDEIMSLPGLLDADLPETAQRVARQAELVVKGVVYALSRGPQSLWTSLTRAGRAFEEEFYQQPRRRRVPY